MNVPILARDARIVAGSQRMAPPPRPEPSRAKLLGVVAAAVVLALLPGVSYAADAVLFEAESMSFGSFAQVISATSGSGGQALRWNSSGTATKQITTTEDGQDIVVSARTTANSGTAPTMRVLLDGQQVGSFTNIASGSFSEQVAEVAVPAGTHTIAIGATVTSAKRLVADTVRVPAGAAPRPAYGAVADGNACEGVNVSPTQSIEAVVNANPAGTTFCIQDGTHTVGAGEGIVVQTGDRFIGEYSDASFPHVTTTQAKNVFDGRGGNSAYFEDLEISGAQYPEGFCTPEPNCGRGIRPGGGAQITVVNSWLHDNENNGIGGGGDQTILVERSTIGPNNGNEDSGRDVIGEEPVSAAGIKVTHSTSLTVRDSLVADNYWDGLWCDIDCHGFFIHDSLIRGNGRAGLHYEISTGPSIIEGNVIQDNGKSNPVNQSTPAGLLLQNSTDADIFNNDFGGNLNYAAHFASSSSRTPQTARVHFHDNRLNGDLLKGCSLTGVTCENNQ